MGRHKKFLSAVVLLALLIVPGVGAQDVIQGYAAKGNLQPGMVVQLEGKGSGIVSAVSQKNVNDMLGVVVRPEDAPFVVEDTTLQDQVFVAATGKYEVLVSTENGSIKANDLITASSLKGISMRADTQQQNILGKALSGFDESRGVTSKMTLKNGRTVAVGRILADVTVAHNPYYQSSMVNGVPRFLAQAAFAVTNRPVAAARIYAALVVLLVVTAISGSLLFSAVRSTFVAIGRNPLARHAITKKMFEVMLMATVIFIIGLIGVYLLLRL